MKKVHSTILVFIFLFCSIYAQVTPVKDDFRTSLLHRAENISYAISPKGDWVLEQVRYIIQDGPDSIEVFIFPYYDSLNKTKLVTFYALPGLYVWMYMGDRISSIGYLYHSMWSTNEDTVYFGLTGSTINTLTDTIEVFKIDVSLITANIDKNGNSNFMPKPLKALNYPNPFNHSTVIKYSLPKDNYIAINIYNNQGKLIRALEQKYKKSGTYSVKWDGKDNNGNRMANGEYYYQIISGDLITTKKMIFLK